jgi:hypothetical protein
MAVHHAGVALMAGEGRSRGEYCMIDVKAQDHGPKKLSIAPQSFATERLEWLAPSSHQQRAARAAVGRMMSRTASNFTLGEDCGVSE